MCFNILNNFPNNSLQKNYFNFLLNFIKDLFIYSDVCLVLSCPGSASVCPLRHQSPVFGPRRVKPDVAFCSWGPSNLAF